MFLGLEIGSWSSILGSISTTLAVIIALKENFDRNNLKYIISVRLRCHDEKNGEVNNYLVLNYISKNNYNVGVQVYGVEFYKRIYSMKPTYISEIRKFDENEKILSFNRLDQVEESFFSLRRLSKIKKKKSVYAKAFLLDTSGKYSYSRKFKFNFEDIDNDISNISKP